MVCRIFGKQQDQIRSEVARYIPTNKLPVKLVPYSGEAGAPSFAVSNAMTMAFKEGFDYFYQVNYSVLLFNGIVQYSHETSRSTTTLDLKLVDGPSVW